MTKKRLFECGRMTIRRKKGNNCSHLHIRLVRKEREQLENQRSDAKVARKYIQNVERSLKEGSQGRKRSYHR